MSSAISFLFFRLSGTSPLTMRSARPSTIAVLPTPGSPIKHRIVLRAARREPGSCGGSLHRGRSPDRPCRCLRRLGHVARIFLQRVILSSAEAESAVRPLRISWIARSSACGVTPAPGAAPCRPRCGVNASASSNAQRLRTCRPPFPRLARRLRSSAPASATDRSGRSPSPRPSAAS